MILLVALLIALICTVIGALVHLPGLGLLVGVVLAATSVWASTPSPRR